MISRDCCHLPRKRPESSLKMVTLMTKTLWTLLLSIGLLAAANSADAGVLGRHLGLGWGDGYHARCDCGHGCGLGLFGHWHGCGQKACTKGKGKGAMVAPCYRTEPQMAPTFVPPPEVIPY
mgnify:CR=1 FL=1